MNTQLRNKFGIPVNAFVHIPDNWKQSGQQMDERFQVVTFYTDGNRTLSETALLLEGIAEFRVQIGTGAQRSFNLHK